MNDQEIIEARMAYERAVWDVFSETMICNPDMAAGRREYNERCAVLHAALPPEVDAVLREWQRPS